MEKDPQLEATAGAIRMTDKALSKPKQYVEPMWIGSIIDDLIREGRTKDEMIELADAILNEAEG